MDKLVRVRRLLEGGDVEYIDVLGVPPLSLESVRWRAASAIAPKEAGDRYRIGPGTDWAGLQLPQVVPPNACVGRSELP